MVLPCPHLRYAKKNQAIFVGTDFIGGCAWDICDWHLDPFFIIAGAVRIRLGARGMAVGLLYTRVCDDG